MAETKSLALREESDILALSGEVILRDGNSAAFYFSVLVLVAACFSGGVAFEKLRAWCLKKFRARSVGVQADVKAGVRKRVQAQTTYTSLRGNAQSRFQALPAYGHSDGCWSE